MELRAYSPVEDVARLATTIHVHVLVVSESGNVCARHSLGDILRGDFRHDQVVRIVLCRFDLDMDNETMLERLHMKSSGRTYSGERIHLRTKTDELHDWVSVAFVLKVAKCACIRIQ